MFILNIHINKLISYEHFSSINKSFRYLLVQLLPGVLALLHLPSFHLDLYFPLVPQVHQHQANLVHLGILVHPIKAARHTVLSKENSYTIKS